MSVEVYPVLAGVANALVFCEAVYCPGWLNALVFCAAEYCPGAVNWFVAPVGW